MFTIEDAPETVAGYRVPGARKCPWSLIDWGTGGSSLVYVWRWRRMVRCPLGDVLRPAINSARHGYAPNGANRGGIAGNAERWKRDFPETARVFLKNGRPPKKGENAYKP